MNTQDARDWLAERVSRETMAQLEIYHDLLLKWQTTINLVAPSTLDTIWCRHIVDSAQLFFLAEGGPKTWLDLGSGAGLPGLIVACLSGEQGNHVKVSMVESDTRKCGFLREASRRMGLSIQIFPNRINDIPVQSADVISARALADLRTLVALAEPHAHAGTSFLFPKGATYQDELDTLDAEWQTAVEVIPSVTDPDAVILHIRMPKRGKDI